MALKQSARDSDRKTLIFDADDTLWVDDAFYRKACVDFSSFVNELGLDGELALKHRENIDLCNATGRDFSNASYVSAMKKAYEYVCAEAGKAPDIFAKEKIGEIGRSTFTAVRTLFPGAREVLERLKAEGYRLVLMTVGDEELQGKKIIETHVGEIFEKIYIIKSKDVAAYRRVMSEMSLNPETTFMIGNSLRSDVLPALEAGLNSIHIPNETWTYENATNVSLESYKEKYNVVLFITDVPALLERLESRNAAKPKEKSKN
jgi:putative hydrolase of the HAD superfamily